jgi:hypothetical protein
MGLCIDENENKQGLNFEIRSKSVTFYLDDGMNIELNKDELKRIVSLCNDPKWNKKLLRERE